MSQARPWVIGSLVVVALVVLAALVWWAMGSDTGGAAIEADTTGAAGSAWSSGSAVASNTLIRDFLDDLTQRVGFPLYVTSGIRRARDQARAMLRKVQLGGEDELSIYKRKDLIAELLAAPQTEDAWTAVIEEQVSRGDLLSSHLSARAFDLRTTASGVGQLTEAQIATVMQAAAELGGRVLREDTPPHLHIELSA